jgi:Tol biopolymer transport system component
VVVGEKLVRTGSQSDFRKRRLLTALLWAVLIVLALATLSPGHAWFWEKEHVFRIRNPSFSPDSKFLVIDYLRDRKKAVLAIWDLESGRLKMLPTAPKGQAWVTPAFSPDGDHIIFSDCTLKTHVCHIATIDRDGSNYRQLTVSENVDYPGIEQPSYSPDGSKVLFLRKTPGNGPGDIYELDLATGVETRLTHRNISQVISLHYLPDGSNFIFDGYGPTGFDPKKYHTLYRYNYVFIMGPDRGYDFKPAFTHGDSSSIPSMSADGRKILFRSSAEKNQSLVVRSGGKNRQITHQIDSIENAILSPDGNTAFFYADVARAPKYQPTSKKPRYAYWLINSDGTNMREIRFPDQVP